VNAHRGHPASRALVRLLTLPAAQQAMKSKGAVLASLVAWGAPLTVTRGGRRAGLEATLVDALDLARRDGTVLRVLPAVLARNAQSLNFKKLQSLAREANVRNELGWLLEQTGELTGNNELALPAQPLRDRRRRSQRYYPEVKSRFERELARRRSAPVARRWGLAMNVSVESLRKTLLAARPKP
jgi:hypothetical protein